MVDGSLSRHPTACSTSDGDPCPGRSTCRSGNWPRRKRQNADEGAVNPLPV